MALSVLDRTALAVLFAGSLFVGARAWLNDHPQHDPWAPLSLQDQDGWATSQKVAALRGDRTACRAFLKRSGIPFVALEPAGEGTCRRIDRKVIEAPATLDVGLRPRGAQATCAVDAGLAWWLQHGVQPAAQALYNMRVSRIEHLGTASCRRIGNGSTGNWSEHATGNAIDIAAFILADGRRVSIRQDWTAKGESGVTDAAFLHRVRDAACASFSTVLSPDYNAAHADHLHLDQAERVSGWSACR